MKKSGSSWDEALCELWVEFVCQSGTDGEVYFGPLETFLPKLLPHSYVGQEQRILNLLHYWKVKGNLWGNSDIEKR